MKPVAFLKIRFFALSLSCLVILSLWGATILRGGFNIGIDFKSGLDIIILFPDSTTALPPTSDIYNLLTQLKGLQVRKVENNQMILRVPSTDKKDFQQYTEKTILEVLNKNFSDVQIISSDFVGASYSASMVRKSLLLTIGTLMAIILYLWIRFEFSYAISAVLSTLHDAIIVLGFIGALQFEFNVSAVAAILTIIGYSLNDTIVTFDRIRENRLMSKRPNMSQIIELSIGQTLNRTLITSITTLLAIIPIALVSVGNIRLFSIEIIVGIFVGTYSSIFIAGMSLNAFHTYQEKSKLESSANSVYHPQYGGKKRKKVNSSE